MIRNDLEMYNLNEDIALNCLEWRYDLCIRSHLVGRKALMMMKIKLAENMSSYMSMWVCVGGGKGCFGDLGVKKKA